tara:strand:- start:81 stop:287 length:207 start_codon:yes stop_codon:yes gene_type:complete
MNKTIEQIQQERIDVLNQTINVMNRIIKSDEEQINILKHAIQIDKITIKTQEKTIKLYIDNLNSNTYV